MHTQRFLYFDCQQFLTVLTKCGGSEKKYAVVVGIEEFVYYITGGVLELDQTPVYKIPIIIVLFQAPLKVTINFCT